MICCAKGKGAIVVGIAVWAVLVATGWTSSAEAKKKKKAKDVPSAEELFNPLLSVERSHWLVGPIAHVATEAEIAQYLALDSDAGAAAFVAEFWVRRNADTPIFQDTPEKKFHLRVAEADKRFSEGGVPGSRTDRGVAWVLYGEPETVTFPIPEGKGDPTPEQWNYPADAKPGLDGERPAKSYQFIKLGDLTVTYKASMRRDPRLRDPRERLRPN